MEFFSPFDDARSNTILLGLIVAAAGCGLFICSWSMKLACRFCGGREIGILRGLVAFVACTTASAGAMNCVTGITSEASAAVVSLYGLFAAVGTLAMVLVQNPVRALFTYIVHALIGGAFTLAAAAAVAAVVYFAVTEEKLEQLAKHYAPNSQLAPGETMTTLEQLVGSGQDVPATQPVAPPPQKKSLPRGVRSNPFVN